MSAIKLKNVKWCHRCKAIRPDSVHHQIDGIRVDAVPSLLYYVDDHGQLWIDANDLESLPRTLIDVCDWCQHELSDEAIDAWQCDNCGYISLQRRDAAMHCDYAGWKELD